MVAKALTSRTTTTKRFNTDQWGSSFFFMVLKHLARNVIPSSFLASLTARKKLKRSLFEITLRSIWPTQWKSNEAIKLKHTFDIVNVQFAEDFVSSRQGCLNWKIIRSKFFYKCVHKFGQINHISVSKLWRTLTWRGRDEVVPHVASLWCYRLRHSIPNGEPWLR